MVDTLPFESLDFLYVPSRDVAVDSAYFTEVLGGRQIFAIEPPHVLLTDHVEGDRPILIYRVADLATTLARLQAAGWEQEDVFEIPHGPCCSFRTPEGHRIAVYQLTRPEVAAHFEGRRDF
jgi:hypothetical protein